MWNTEAMHTRGSIEEPPLIRAGVVSITEFAFRAAPSPGLPRTRNVVLTYFSRWVLVSGKPPRTVEAIGRSRYGELLCMYAMKSFKFGLILGEKPLLLAPIVSPFTLISFPFVCRSRGCVIATPSVVSPQFKSAVAHSNLNAFRFFFL